MNAPAWTGSATAAIFASPISTGLKGSAPKRCASTRVLSGEARSGLAHVGTGGSDGLAGSESDRRRGVRPSCAAAPPCEEVGAGLFNGEVLRDVFAGRLRLDRRVRDLRRGDEDRDLPEVRKAGLRPFQRVPGLRPARPPGPSSRPCLEIGRGDLDRVCSASGAGVLNRFGIPTTDSASIDLGRLLGERPRPSASARRRGRPSASIPGRSPWRRGGAGALPIEPIGEGRRLGRSVALGDVVVRAGDRVSEAPRDGLPVGCPSGSRPSSARAFRRPSSRSGRRRSRRPSRRARSSARMAFSCARTPPRRSRPAASWIITWYRSARTCDERVQPPSPREAAADAAIPPTTDRHGPTRAARGPRGWPSPPSHTRPPS